MMRAGFVDMQLVPRAADRAPSRSFFTWTFNEEGAFRRITGGVAGGIRGLEGHASGGGMRVGGRAPSRSFLTWTINEERAFGRITGGVRVAGIGGFRVHARGGGGEGQGRWGRPAAA